jgi:hypothetical protein
MFPLSLEDLPMSVRRGLGKSFTQNHSSEKYKFYRTSIE